MPSPWIDFAGIREQARFEIILQHYGMKATGSGHQRMILCPFHDETTPSCSIHFARKIFHCFGCGAKGTIVDFVAKTENLDLRSAALKIEQICGRTRVPLGEKTNLKVDQCENTKNIRPVPALNLDREHPYLKHRGLGKETVEIFGLGYCSHGVMRGRICIPIHDESGRLVAYAGRWANDLVPQNRLRYVLPRRFPKREVLFNLHRLPPTDHIVIVEGFWSVFRLHMLGLPVVSLMGRSISQEQIALLQARAVQMLSILMDGDEPGYLARDQLAASLTRYFCVRAPPLRPGTKPDGIPEAELLALAGGLTSAVLHNTYCSPAGSSST